MNVYLLHHERAIEGVFDESKLLGIYSSFSAAEDACLRYARKPGFSDFPEGFSISSYPINEVFWVDGFVTKHDGDVICDVPCWATDALARKSENAEDFANRLMCERFEEANFPKGPTSEYSQLVKYALRILKR